MTRKIALNLSKEAENEVVILPSYRAKPTYHHDQK